MAVFNINNLKRKKIKPEVEKPFIMLVDDEQENINSLRYLLGADYKIVSASNGREALEIIDDMTNPHLIQLIVSDQRMPELSGVDFFVKIVNRMPDTIRIILTGYSDIQTIIDSINEAQIFKFMTKPVEPEELKLTVRRGIEVFNMRRKLIEQTQKLEEMVESRTRELRVALSKLEKLSLTDQLTGAKNRRFIENVISAELAEVKRSYNPIDNTHPTPKSLGFILIDVDHFKNINDTYGHNAGDKVLIQLTQLLKATCRESDWVVRWGGEEFLIICRDSCLSTTEQLAERIRLKMAAHMFDIGNGITLNKTCSLGVSCYPFNPTNVDFFDWEQVLYLADSALYKAKNSGRNAWVSIFNGDLGTVESPKSLLDTDTESLIQSGHLGVNSSNSM